MKTLFPGEPQGHLASRLNTLAAIISGIVGSKSTYLSAIAGKVPVGAGDKGARAESRVKRFERWLRNKAVDSETFFVPFAEALLLSLSHAPLTLAIDGSIVGRGCMTLMLSVVYKQRALPLIWIVAKRKKGHFPESLHLELISKAQQLVPRDARVVVVGDGEFDGVDLQGLLKKSGWDYVLRTSKTATLTWKGEQFRFDDMTDQVAPGEVCDVPGVLFIQRKFGPIVGITWWRQDCKEPIHLITNMTSVAQACACYRRRFKIETLFSDKKSRGFHLHKSHLSDPARLSRLLIATCLAYCWIVYLGAYAMEQGLNMIIHRTKRCDLSLFQLGFRLLNHLLNEELAIPVAFKPPTSAQICVR